MTAGYVHEALLYESIDDLLAGTVPAIRAAVAAEQPVLVAIGRERGERIAQELGTDALSVRFEDMAHLGRNPGRIIPAWREFVDGACGRPVFGVGEPIWPGRTADEIDECMRHECLLNVAFDRTTAFTLLCPYDAAGLDDDVLDGAHRVHARDGDPFGGIDPFGGSLPEPPASAGALEFGPGELSGVRDFVTRAARVAGLTGERRSDLVLAVSEAAANSVRHGGGRGRVLTWQEGDGLVCEVADDGVIRDPLAGRVPPTLSQDCGRGLWMIHQLCDLVRLRSGATGTQLRLHMGPGPIAASSLG